MSEIPRIGRCDGCGLGRRLTNDACDKCRATFGPNAGRTLKRIREDREFAAKCYEACDRTRKRAFIQYFGLPEGCVAV